MSKHGFFLKALKIEMLLIEMLHIKNILVKINSQMLHESLNVFF